MCNAPAGALHRIIRRGFRALPYDIVGVSGGNQAKRAVSDHLYRQLYEAHAIPVRPHQRGHLPCDGPVHIR
jgi:hypothetical protein